MRKVLVTGANKGIGFAIVNAFLEKKEYKVIAVSRSTDRLSEISNSRFEYRQVDLTNNNQVEELLEWIEEEPIDILINNAGSGYFANVEDIGFDKWREMIVLNLEIPYRLISKCVVQMKKMILVELLILVQMQITFRLKEGRPTVHLSMG